MDNNKNKYLIAEIEVYRKPSWKLAELLKLDSGQKNLGALFLRVYRDKYLYDYAKEQGVNIEKYNDAYKELVKLYNHYLKTDEQGFWRAVQQDMDKEFKYLDNLLFTAFTTNEIYEMEYKVLPIRSAFQIYLNYFPEKYGDLSEYRKKVKDWDERFKSKALDLHDDPEYKGIFTSYWLPRDEFWWEHIWDTTN